MNVLHLFYDLPGKKEENPKYEVQSNGGEGGNHMSYVLLIGYNLRK